MRRVRQATAGFEGQRRVLSLVQFLCAMLHKSFTVRRTYVRHQPLVDFAAIHPYARVP